MASGSHGLKARQRRRRTRPKHRGFTLLEVMIALAIFATLAAAVIAASHYSLRHNARLKEQVQCAWVADNQLSELRLQSATPGRQQLLRHFDGRDWIVEQTLALATDPRLLEVDISVSPADGGPAVYHTRGWIPVVHE